MGENVTLDHIEIEKLIAQAKAARAEYIRRHGTAAFSVVGFTLRAHPVIAVVAILLISFGVKMFFLSAPTAQAEIPAVPSTSMNILQMHSDHPNGSNLPLQQMNDMTFVYPNP